jgi:hypothetical protein
MKSKLLLSICAIFLLALPNLLKAQSVTVLAGESPKDAAHEHVSFGDFDDGGFFGTSCNFNRGKGMLSVSVQFQSNGIETWDDLRIAVEYGGTWYYLCAVTVDGNNNVNVPFLNTSGSSISSLPDANYYSDGAGNYHTATVASNSGITYYKINENDWSGNRQSVYLYDYGNLKIYNGNYNVQAGGITNPTNKTDEPNTTFQCYQYSGNQLFPMRSGQAAGNPIVNTGIPGSKYSWVGSNDGSYVVSTDANHESILFNIANLPPAMLQAQSFRVHIYSQGNTHADDEIYETVYNNQNFMTSPPSGLTATQNLCGKVTLNWSNSNNSLPTDGMVTLKTAIFRNGTWIATVANATTTYDDLTASQDVTYNYTLRHLAFSESQKTYFQTDPCAQVQGSVLPSPDQPINQAASKDDCGNNINLSWATNGGNPKYFRIDTAFAAAGPYATIVSNIAGTARNYTHSGVTRGRPYYYKIYSISTCNVASNTAADCNGISPSAPAMATGLVLSQTADQHGFILKWTDNANNETKYQVNRKDDQGNGVPFDLNAVTGSGSTITFTDSAVAVCRTYTYQVNVFNSCVLNGVLSNTQVIGTLPPPNLATTFTPAKKVVGSKGYFNNRVELTWSNNNNNVLSHIHIYRRQLTSLAAPTEINAVPPGTGIYVDNTADAGVFYLYTLKAEAQCGGTSMWSDSTSDVGYRNPTAVVNGQVNYAGGIAVQNVQITLEKTTGPNSLSAVFNGTDSVGVTSNASLSSSGAVCLDAWVNFSSLGATDQILIEKFGSYKLFYQGSSRILIMQVTSGAVNTNAQDSVANHITAGSFYHVSGLYDGSHLKLYVNGTKVDSVVGPASINVNANAVAIGNGFAGKMTEIRIWNQPRTSSDVKRDYQRILNGDELGLILLYHTSENAGTYLYDISKAGATYNMNDGLFSSNPAWSTTIPGSGQMGYIVYTDATGNYTIGGVRYNGTGENFKAIPAFGVHAFSPSSQVMFIGDGAAVQNGINFTDNSAFRVQGHLNYDTTKFKHCTCPVPGAFLNVDGNPVIVAGTAAKTDVNGHFDIRVPIGQHVITLSQSGHSYSAGRYPVIGSFDFQDSLSGMQFWDTTTQKVVGRVVGGTHEAAKAMILGKSVNNLGKTVIVFHTQSGCWSDTVITNAATGEYVANLLPMMYTLDNLKIPSNPASLAWPEFQNIPPLDLNAIHPLQMIHDSVFTYTGVQKNFVRVDSGSYQKILSWNHREVPSLWVHDSRNRDFYQYGGDTAFIFTNPAGVKTTYAINNSTFGYPIFQQQSNYSMKMGAIETYVNLDGGLTKTDVVPVTKGAYTINNGLSVNSGPQVIPQDTGSASFISARQDTAYISYQFQGGSPNIVFNPGQDNFLQQLAIDFTSGPNTIHWLPRTPTALNASRNFQAILQGGQSSDGQGFVSTGPSIVEMVLRDPPGSNSFATFEKGTTTTLTHTWHNAGTTDTDVNTTIHLGAKFSVGFGFETQTEVTNDLALNAHVSTSCDQQGQDEQTITTTQNWSTDGTSAHVGAMSDIYVGRAMNMNFGLTEDIAIIPSSTVHGKTTLDTSEIGSTAGTQFTVVRRKSLAVIPSGYATAFTYTQDYIVNTLVPNLTTLRNQLFTNQPLKYVDNTHFAQSNPKYGTNNDDPIWGALVSSANPITTLLRDSTGQSYTYHGGKSPTIVRVKSTTGSIVIDTIPPSQGDSVRWYNQQIRLWKQAVIENEEEKYKAYHDPSNLVQNYSISEGATYQNTVQSENSSQSAFVFELGISAQATLKLGAVVGGIGLEDDQSLAVSYGHGYSNTTNVSNETTFSFTLQDTGPGDYFATDVRSGYKGWGPIFNLSGGQTRCPYEGKDTSIYYVDPGTGKHVAFGVATLQTEKVGMKVDGNLHFSQKDNIPSGGQAVYSLEIINNTESTPGLSVTYAMIIPAEKNPHGAVLSIDGGNPATQQYPVPPGGSIFKQLVLRQGPTEFNYDSIQVVVYSACGDAKVADTLYVSAHFVPACTPITLTAPLNQWVANNSFHDTLNTVISGYDINYNGLKSITFEYKASSQAVWVPLQTWYLDSVGPGILPISKAQFYTSYPWVLTELQDDHYDIRALSTCQVKVGGALQTVTNQSQVFNGIVDRINPAPFGTPSPATGILNPGDDISIQFNKPLDGGALTDFNFDIRGVLNGAPIAHSTSLYFDGAASYAEVVGGASLQKRDFTLEFWAKRSALGEQAVITQGPDVTQSLFFGFNSADQLALRFGGVEIFGDKAAATDTVNWHHYAVAYIDTLQTAYLYADYFGSGTTPLNSNTSMTAYYAGAGKLYFGKEIATNSKYYKGLLQEVRLWNGARTSADIASNQGTVLSTNTGGLMYDWRMDEADGTTAADAIRLRNATLNSTTWQINPHGYACAFDGSTGLVQLASSKVAITKEMDFTLEFWFKSAQPGVATLFSNGKGDGLGADSIYAWNIQKDAAGLIHVLHDKHDFVATSSNYFDNTWHHFALVMQRSSTLSAYIDGSPQNSIASGSFKQMGGANMFVGARGYMVGAILNKDNYFNGSLDEVRFWNTSRLIKQVQRDMRNRMLGNEAGLKLYLPFESYVVNLGIPVLAPSIKDFSTDSLVTTNTAGATIVSNTPTLKLPRPIQEVVFTYSLNTDKIIMTSTMSPAEIENVTLDVTVEKVHDLDGNYMQSPKTWIAFINQNQVKWQNQGITMTKLLNVPSTFTATIVNSGGALKAYTIGNMPSWLSVDAATGNLAPNSTKLLTFTVDPGVNIGDYTEDITLTTDFNFAEKFTLSLNVYAQPPAWSVNPSNYQYSEGVVGQIRIDGITSTNPGDMLAAFSGTTCRGVTNLKYYPAYDKYYAVMDMYSNNNTGDTMTFKIWNATEGKEHTQIVPANMIFSADSVRGTYVKPQMFDATDKLTRTLPLKAGWNWISVNVLSADSTNLNNFLKSLHPQTGDVLKAQTSYSDYSTQFGWTGSLAAPTAGVKVEPSYRIKVLTADTLVFSGKQIDPTTKTITLHPGWNWTGFVSLRNLTVKEALANLSPTGNDIIKGQSTFALYDSILGWSGSLTYMQPNQGYMIRSAKAAQFVYPITGINGKHNEPALQTVNTTWKVQENLYANNMNLVAKLDCGASSAEHLSLGAFVNGVCRGVTPVSTDPGTEGIFFLTLFSDSTAETIHLQLMDELSGKVYVLDNSVDFKTNTLMSTLRQPTLLKLTGADLAQVCKSADPAAAQKETLLSVDPSPFRDAFNLNMNVVEAGPVHLKITSVTGQVIYETGFDALAGINTKTFSAQQLNMSPGMYIVEMTTTSAKIVTRLIKQ